MSDQEVIAQINFLLEKAKLETRAKKKGKNVFFVISEKDDISKVFQLITKDLKPLHRNKYQTSED